MSETQSKTTILRVTARPPQGFRRAGRYWPPQASDVAAGEFTEAQRAALAAEPQLIVQEVETEPAAAGGDGRKGGQGKKAG